MASSRSSSSAAAMKDPETNNHRRKEEDSSQEGKSDIGLVLIAFGFASDAVPVPNAAAVHWTNIVDEQTRGNHVKDEEDEIRRPMEEAGSKGEEEDQREENAQGGDDLSIDKPLFGPC